MSVESVEERSTDGVRVLIVVVAVLAAVMALFGYGNSIPNLVKFGREVGVPWPDGAALVVELGIPAFLLLDFAFTMRRFKTALFRWAAWGLAGGTVWVNSAVAPDLGSKGAVKMAWVNGVAVATAESGVTAREVAAHILYAAMPVVPIVVVEGMRLYALYTARKKHARTEEEMDRIRRTRWLVAPYPTLVLWRRMILWEITSYREAVLRAEALLFARSVASATLRKSGLSTKRKAWKHAPDLLREQLQSGRMPIRILAAVRTAVADPNRDWEAVVADWVRTAIARESASETPTESAGESGLVPPVWDPELADRVRTGSGAKVRTRSGIESAPAGRTESGLGRRTKSGPKRAPKATVDPIQTARELNAAHIERHDRPISAETLRGEMKIAMATAREYVRAIREESTTDDAPAPLVRAS